MDSAMKEALELMLWFWDFVGIYGFGFKGFRGLVAYGLGFYDGVFGFYKTC